MYLQRSRFPVGRYLVISRPHKPGIYAGLIRPMIIIQGYIALGDSLMNANLAIHGWIKVLQRGE